MQHQGVVPDTITYNALISACAKGKQPEQALEPFKARQQQGVVSDTIAYSALISAREKGKRWGRCPGLLAEMRREDVCADAITLSTLARLSEASGEPCLVPKLPNMSQLSIWTSAAECCRRRFSSTSVQL